MRRAGQTDISVVEVRTPGGELVMCCAAWAGDEAEAVERTASALGMRVPRHWPKEATRYAFDQENSASHYWNCMVPRRVRRFGFR